MKIRSTDFAGKTVIISQKVNNGKLSFDADGLSADIETEDNDYISQLASVLNGEVVDPNQQIEAESESISEITDVIPIFRHISAGNESEPSRRGRKKQ